MQNMFNTDTEYYSENKKKDRFSNKYPLAPYSLQSIRGIDMPNNVQIRTLKTFFFFLLKKILLCHASLAILHLVHTGLVVIAKLHVTRIPPELLILDVELLHDLLVCLPDGLDLE